MPAIATADEMIRTWSTTWYEPVMAMPGLLKDATAAAYLCMRAIDEIEDHPILSGTTKAVLLRKISALFQGHCTESSFDFLMHTKPGLPEVTLRLGEWATLAPSDIAPRVLDTFSIMAERMASWAEEGFVVHTEQDLDRYTYAVAGTLVLMLCDLWAWHNGTPSNRTHGIAYGRALQSVNIIIDRHTDISRNVDFWPDGWDIPQMTSYACQELALADTFVAALPFGAARTFCTQPLHRAHQALKQIPASH